MPLHIIQARSQDIARYVLAPGDQARARKIAERLTDAYPVAESRGYLVYSGRFQNTFVTVCATGMGGPAVAIALEELAGLGADTFVRVGSCGVLQPGLGPGDIVVSTGAVRLGGTGYQYLPAEFPAVPTFEVTRALVESADELGLAVHAGLAISTDAFYAPPRDLDLAKRAHVLAIEMESDTLFLVGQYRGWRTGALFASDGTEAEVKPEWGEAAFRQGETRAIEIALHAVKRLAQADAKAGRN
jgi:DeoD family purine-nucleoside phosphorylase